MNELIINKDWRIVTSKDNHSLCIEHTTCTKETWPVHIWHFLDPQFYSPGSCFSCNTEAPEKVIFLARLVTL